MMIFGEHHQTTSIAAAISSMLCDEATICCAADTRHLGSRGHSVHEVVAAAARRRHSPIEGAIIVDVLVEISGIVGDLVARERLRVLMVMVVAAADATVGDASAAAQISVHHGDCGAVLNVGNERAWLHLGSVARLALVLDRFKIRIKRFL